MDEGASNLQARLGRPRDEWTVDDLTAVARDLGIRLVSLLHVGGDGLLKTLDFAPRTEQRLRRILAGGERADGSSLFAGLRAGASDIVLRPRPQTAFLDPFAPAATLCVLCGHHGRDDRPLPESPDTIVRQADQRLREQTGARLEALGEIEFFLGRFATDADAHCTSDGGYHATAPFVHGEDLRRRALLCLAEMDIPVKYGHAEVGYIDASAPGGLIWEQHEVELDLLPLARAADAIVLAQWVIRNLARREGLQCSMEPVVGPGHAGNGLHVHFAFAGDGRHEPVLDSDGQMREPARWLTAGLTELAGALMAFGNRSNASFVRLDQGKESPTRLDWGLHDRHALVRVPLVPADADAPAPTVEFRLPDGSAHPHLLLAAAAQAMCHGRQSAKADGLGAPSEATLPRSGPEIAAALERRRQSLQHGGVFPAALIDALADRLRAGAPPA
ncbi:MAG: glutamine synthetase beta-grasp domain-containing protein [Phycisphaerales bacterium JB039]